MISQECTWRAYLQGLLRACVRACMLFLTVLMSTMLMSNACACVMRMHALTIREQVFGDKGRHARTAVGVAALPLGACVEVDAIVEIAP